MPTDPQTIKEKKVVVVIPLLTARPDSDETLVLNYYLRLYAAYPVVFVIQTALPVEFYQQAAQQQGHGRVSFERFDWEDFAAYNRLLVSGRFYARFLDYDYMLMVHLDSFAFDADLSRWCALGYDYIGAVVYHKSFVKDYIRSSRLLRLLDRVGLLRTNPLQNGGFSLRKVASFYRNSVRFAPLVRHTAVLYTEDLFWSMRLPLVNPFFRVAPTRIARQFAIELPDARSSDFNPFVGRLHHLPMGCHGWKTFGYTFWKSILESFTRQPLAKDTEQP